LGLQEGLNATGAVKSPLPCDYTAGDGDIATGDIRLGA